VLRPPPSAPEGRTIPVSSVMMMARPTRVSQRTNSMAALRGRMTLLLLFFGTVAAAAATDNPLRPEHGRLKCPPTRCIVTVPSACWGLACFLHNALILGQPQLLLLLLLLLLPWSKLLLWVDAAATASGGGVGGL
jgi:hypothetical protein